MKTDKKNSPSMVVHRQGDGKIPVGIYSIDIISESLTVVQKRRVK